MPHVEPARRSADAVRPISSASSRRAASSGVSPRRTPPPGKCQPARYSALARGQGRHRPRQRRPDASGASVATRCGQAEDQDGKLSARQSREVTKAGLDLTCRQSLHLTMIRTLAAAAAPSVIADPALTAARPLARSRPPARRSASISAACANRERRCRRRTAEPLPLGRARPGACTPCTRSRSSRRLRRCCRVSRVVRSRIS